MSRGAGHICAGTVEESGPGQRGWAGWGPFEEWNTAGVSNTAHADAPGAPLTFPTAAAISGEGMWRARCWMCGQIGLLAFGGTVNKSLSLSKPPSVK